ncbi:MAG TPA: kelch repeat-containing protein [Candidatus Angelobacter sp.]
MEYRRANTLSLMLLASIILTALANMAVAQSWTESGPLNREGHSAVLDTTTNRMIVFGGLPNVANTNSQSNLNDVWRLNGTGGTNLSWTHVHPTGTAPVGRWGHTAVYDPSSNRMIVFGGGEGRTSPCDNDVWVLTNANGTGGTPAWLQLSPAGSAPAPRVQHGSVYDPNTNTMIIYGGDDCFSTIFGDVWVLSNANGLTGTPTWMQLNPTGGGPGPREISGGVAYDSTNNRLIVFGGQTIRGGIFNDVWVLTNANGQGGIPTWIQITPSGTLPAARTQNSTTYDLANNRLTIFAGEDASANALGDAWVLMNANGIGGTPTWTQIASTSTDFPEARLLHTAVYNASTNKMTVFGGKTVSCCGVGGTVNDVFVLSHANGR